MPHYTLISIKVLQRNTDQYLYRNDTCKNYLFSVTSTIFKVFKFLARNMLK